MTSPVMEHHFALPPRPVQFQSSHRGPLASMQRWLKRSASETIDRFCLCLPHFTTPDPKLHPGTRSTSNGTCGVSSFHFTPTISSQTFPAPFDNSPTSWSLARSDGGGQQA